jgi:hypothetical protein
MTVKITVEAGPGQQTWVMYEERYDDPETGKHVWLLGKRGPIPLAVGERQDFWVHSHRRITVSEDGLLA